MNSAYESQANALELAAEMWLIMYDCDFYFFTAVFSRLFSFPGHLAVRTVLVVIIIVIIVLPVHIIAFILRASLRSGREEGGQGQEKEEFEHDW